MKPNDSEKGGREDVLGLGKVGRDTLRRSVFPFIPLAEEPSLDGGAFNLHGRTIVAHSPSIGVPLESLGFFAFHYAASNVACLFGRPRLLITGIYLPLRTREKDLQTIARTIGEEGKKYGVNVVAGQTATYYGLDIPLVTATCLGDSVRDSESPRIGDKVMIVGAVGREALWLKALSEGHPVDSWRSFTPLPAVLRLQEVVGVKRMHDVSEGGVKGAFVEMAEALKIGIDVSSSRIPYAEGTERLGSDVLSAPTYGSMVVIASAGAADEVSRASEEMGFASAVVGIVTRGSSAFVDGVEVTSLERIALDELYGSFKPHDETLDELRAAIFALESHEEVKKLVPQVGTNFVYAKPGAYSVEEIAGLSGRIVVSMGRPRACGEVIYGGSHYLASALLEVLKRNPRIRAAINIRAGDDITKALRDMNFTIRVLPQRVDDACPVAAYVERTNELGDAYVHQGAFGVEPSTVIVGVKPSAILKTVIELARRV